MDNSFRRQEPGARQASGFLASLQIFDAILKWLVAGLIQLTEEERKDAGIYLGDPYYR